MEVNVEASAEVSTAGEVESQPIVTTESNSNQLTSQTISANSNLANCDAASECNSVDTADSPAASVKDFRATSPVNGLMPDHTLNEDMVNRLAESESKMNKFKLLAVRLKKDLAEAKSQVGEFDIAVL